MRPPSLSPDQKQILLPVVRVVEAGPGSGKTRCLVARFLTTANEEKRGVALLSFTNAAVDEVRSRTSDVPHLLRAPHYVGTIDSFLHRFIVTPHLLATQGIPPRYRASWNDLPTSMSQLRLGGLPGAGVNLSYFRIDLSGEVELNKSALKEPDRPYVLGVEKAGRLDSLYWLAQKKITEFNAAGIFDAHSARVMAYKILSSPDGAAILARLAHRFAELLVDEGQDCDEAEFRVITAIREAGVRVIVVADPAQGIYEFRGSHPKHFLAYRDRQPIESQLRLLKNHRSTAPICATATLLRGKAQGEITSLKQGECAPVYLLTGEDESLRLKFTSLLEEYEIPRSEAIVLAHATKWARKVSGSEALDHNSTAIGTRLAVACTVLASSTSPEERLGAVKDMEKLILALIDWPEELANDEAEEQLAFLGRDRDWLRRCCGFMASKLKGIEERAKFSVEARRIASEVLASQPRQSVDLSRRLKQPDEDVWERCLRSLEPRTYLPHKTIHKSKGAEYSAVLLVLPSPLRTHEGVDVLDEIEQGLDTEARRTLYVGASRAMKLLAWAPGRNLQRLRELLESGGVPVEVR